MGLCSGGFHCGGVTQPQWLALSEKGVRVQAEGSIEEALSVMQEVLDGLPEHPGQPATLDRRLLLLRISLHSWY